MLDTQINNEALRIGDRVVMNGNCRIPTQYENYVFTVRSMPCEAWGIPCVLLDGHTGFYPVGGLDRVRE